MRGEPEVLARALRGLTAAGAGELYVWESPPQAPRACEEIARRLDRLKSLGVEIDVIILDYLNIMGSSRQEKEKRHELARTSRDISILARQYDAVAWSAALTKREALDRDRVRKKDIAEVYEVVAVADGMTAIAASTEMREAGVVALWVVAMREAEDERGAGVYRFDRERGIFLPFYERDNALPADRENAPA